MNTTALPARTAHAVRFTLTGIAMNVLGPVESAHASALLSRDYAIDPAVVSILLRAQAGTLTDADRKAAELAL